MARQKRRALRALSPAPPPPKRELKEEDLEYLLDIAAVARLTAVGQFHPIFDANANDGPA